MSHAARTSSAFLISSPLPYKSAACLSSRFNVGASLERKKGFGESAKSSPPSQIHKQQQQESLQGAPAEGKKAIFLQDSRELQSVIKSVEKDLSKKRTGHLKIDKEVAAKGKVDFVKIESWGLEGKDQSDLESLKVKSFSPSFSSRDTAGSFYERLVHRIQLLESKGEISVVHAKSLPPFQDWKFGDERYLHYLVDQHAVFDALRTSIASISDEESKSSLFNENKFAMAVKLFDETLGLERSEALQDDIKSLSKAMSAACNKIVEVPKPSTQTTAYVKYLRQLAGVSKIGKQGYLRLLAHIFAVYVTHLTTGMRIGAKALDCLSILKHCKAVRFYRYYPQNVRDPLKVFIEAINRVAHLVPTDEDQEVVMEELAKAIQKTSLLLVLLAVTETHGNTNAALV